MKTKNRKKDSSGTETNNKKFDEEIPETPPIHATINDLKNFEEFIEQHSNHLKTFGIMKIIPPDDWNPTMDHFDFTSDESGTFSVGFFDVLKSTQNGQRSYIYESAKKEHQDMTILQYQKKAKKIENRFSKLNIGEKEKLILAGNFKNVMYATDVDFPVLKKTYDPLNLNHIPNLLDNYVAIYGHAMGITSPLSYIGAMGSRFGWHVEDMNLFSISFMIFGEPKIWYNIPECQGSELEKVQNKYKMEWPSLQCSHPLRHKNNCFDPNYVRSLAIEVYKTVQNPREIVVTAPGSYHSGMNLGYNFAVALNFAFNSWIPYGKKFTTCDCQTAKFVCDVNIMVGSYGKDGEALPTKKTLTCLTCEVCQKVFKSTSAVNYHRKNSHTNKMFPCRLCKPSRFFKFLKNYEAHIMESHPNKMPSSEMKAVVAPKKKAINKPFSCSQCTSCFHANWSLKQHVKLVHSNLKFKCKECRFECKYEKNLKRHINNLH